jgi:hypothetical protein
MGSRSSWAESRSSSSPWALPIRLTPGSDLPLGLEQVLQTQKEQAGQEELTVGCSIPARDSQN